MCAFLLCAPSLSSLHSASVLKAMACSTGPMSRVRCDGCNSSDPVLLPSYRAGWLSTCTVAKHLPRYVWYAVSRDHYNEQKPVSLKKAAVRRYLDNNFNESPSAVTRTSFFVSNLIFCLKPHFPCATNQDCCRDSHGYHDHCSPNGYSSPMFVPAQDLHVNFKWQK